MIITFTANPSIDATMCIDSLDPGGVLRVSESSREPGGKGINVSNAVLKAGQDTLAIAPAADNDPFTALARSAGIPLRTVPVDGAVRTNTTVTESSGRTTKLNEPGTTLTDDVRRTLETELVDAASHPLTRAAVLAGSLPPGAPADWYPQLVAALRDAAPDLLIAVDTSDEPLKELGRKLEATAPDVVKPNAFELGQLAGIDGGELESQADDGDLDAVVKAAAALVDKGVREVLVTLGGAGACLVTVDGAWHAATPPAQVRSTVGAGDSSLAGYILARLDGKDFPAALRTAVAYGTAAAASPGTAIPSPDDIDYDRTTVREL
ncbi:MULTISPECIES: 1-phosphofructokinase family hexose kinase [unclassified Corynebacterium]|uniref:1-phosphofructokinase family hexose kinase n=1 Tax=unclassified Corynebacterium TaxID=2624378 RepID=UPI0026530B55|nr:MULTISPECIES: hexose kinase [unclassified Corynebacterium]MDN8593791.1 hexose kinase [Corynebacterium sp. P4_F2]WKK55902.1 hexose kinase [Corynebacterium sp. P4-C1]WKK63311.1 hexose kinase [Corynebacterium sp. P8-C1]